MISRRLLRIKILQVLYAYLNTEDKSKVHPDKELNISILKAYDLYHAMLLLLISLKRYALDRIEIARSKRLPSYEDLNPNTRFVDNKVISMIEANDMLKAYVKERKISWAAYPELIKRLYLALTEAEYYTAYMQSNKSGLETDKTLVVDFFVQTVADDALLQQIMEEQSIFWNDDMESVMPMVVKTVKSIHADKVLELMPMYRSDEDKDFAKKLLRAVIRNYADYEKLIEQKIDNWDIERVALTDKLIMQIALNELIEFPSIPVKVTFDEYLEMAKYYSTPKSSIFINGLLDKLCEDLTREGKVVKSGRGLVTE